MKRWIEITFNQKDEELYQNLRLEDSRISIGNVIFKPVGFMYGNRDKITIDFAEVDDEK